MRKVFFALLLLSMGLSSCISQDKKYFVKELTFPENSTAEQKIKLSAYLIPSERQYTWQQLELTAFLHFGINTFTGREWGDGKEDPTLFNPTELNTEQWITSLQEAGFKMVILTAKHHDGFCLWPTATSKHSVASSPWKEGKGDVVRELKGACDKYGMKFGVYLSPWDRNAESYGDSPRYNALFVEQLKELLTNYGEVHEVWFDGANGEGPNGKRQEYDWKRFYHVIDSLQPKAVKAIMGDDVRWVGNERGLGRETEWSVTPLNPDINQAVAAENKRLNIKPTSKDLGNRELVTQAKTLYWYPSEVDVSIRPGWFYHAEEDHRVKTVKQLVDIYYQSVGMNSVLLLNIPPDKRGLLHENDISRLKAFGKHIRNTFENNKVSQSNTAWSAHEGESKEFTLNGDTVNTLLLQEDIRKGQRTEAFQIDGLIGNQWIRLAEGTTIGYKRLLKFTDCAPDKIRITITGSREKTNIVNVSAHYAPPITDEDERTNLNDFTKEKWNIKTARPFTIDLGETVPVKGFSYKPVDGKEPAFNYAFSVSVDGKNWKELKKGEFGNIKNNPIPQIIRFDGSISARFIRFEVENGVDGGKPETTIDQIGILKK